MNTIEPVIYGEGFESRPIGLTVHKGHELIVTDGKHFVRKKEEKERIERINRHNHYKYYAIEKFYYGEIHLHTSREKQI